MASRKTPFHVILLFVLCTGLTLECVSTSGTGTASGTVVRTRYKNGKLFTGAEDAPCAGPALGVLERLDPVGYAVYTEILRTQGAEGKTSFLFWLDCRLKDYKLGTAVHESVHELTRYGRGERFHYWLPSGTYYTVAVKRLFNRSEIAPYLRDEEKDIFFKIYMTGKTGAQDLLILLDELNAYTFSVISALALAGTTGGGMDREGLATMMWYLELYLRHARTNVNGDYQKIVKDERYLLLLKTLWENAEKILVDSSAYKKYGINERYKLRQVYAEANLNELHSVFEKSALRLNVNDSIYALYRLEEELKPVVVQQKDLVDLDKILKDL